VSDLIDAGKKFDEAVRATGVVGGIRADLANVQSDVTEIKIDVKTIKTTMSEWTGSLKVWAAIPSGVAIALSIYSIFFR
jgi:hypothetical protein